MKKKPTVIRYTIITFAEVGGKLLAHIDRREYGNTDTVAGDDLTGYFDNLTEQNTTERALWLANAVKPVDPQLSKIIARNEKGTRDDLKTKRRRGVKVRLTNARGANAELDAERVRELMDREAL